ncbi:MAG TPA: hypothetical protein VHR66_13125 [Gemmataceae bacterium]|nr:hypothetical protein [Gemmataceae bacterium]
MRVPAIAHGVEPPGAQFLGRAGACNLFADVVEKRQSTRRMLVANKEALNRGVNSVTNNPLHVIRTCTECCSSQQVRRPLRIK